MHCNDFETLSVYTVSFNNGGEDFMRAVLKISMHIRFCRSLTVRGLCNSCKNPQMFTCIELFLEQAS